MTFWGTWGTQMIFFWGTRLILGNTDAESMLTTSGSSVFNGLCGLSRIFYLGARKTLIWWINSVVISNICVICVLHMQPGIFDFWGNTGNTDAMDCADFHGFFCLEARKALI